MTRQEFMSQLYAQLNGFPPAEVQRIMDYYEELFSDSLEAGKTEQEITASLDSPAAIAERVRVELAFVRAEQRPSAGNMNTVLIILLSLFALPIGLPLGFAVIMVALAMVMVFISVLISVLAVVVAFGAVGVALVVTGFSQIVLANPLTGFALLGSGLILLALAIIGGVGGVYLTRLICKGTVKLTRSIYNSVTKKNNKAAPVQAAAIDEGSGRA